jgi:tRNA U38,U39,U40 pseudouridine synthase TruA
VEGRSNVRRLTEFTIEETDGLVDFWVQANAFCHQMVRSLVGYLYDVGRGFSDPNRVEEVIASRDRSMVATVAPAHGLTLWDVGYELPYLANPGFEAPLSEVQRPENETTNWPKPPPSNTM